MTGKINFLLVIFYLLGVFMKRFLCVCMCIFILTISVLTYFPTCAYAADDFTLSTVEGGNISSDEANRAVNNKGDIYNANHEILFRYTPTSDYNWTYVNWDVHCSDAQVVACLRSNNKFEAFGALLKAGVSHNAFSRVMLSQLGFLVSENSELGTDFLDRLTENYNYLNAIEYDSSTGDLTLLADKVDSLKNNLLFMYRKSIHAIPYVVKKSSPAYAIELNRSNYEYEEDYVSDWQDANLYDYAFSNQYQGCEISCFNKSDFSYIYISNEDLIHDGVNHAKVDYWSYRFGSIHFVDGSGELVNNLKHIGQFDSVERTYCFYDTSSNISKLWNYNYNVNLSYVYERISNDSEFTWGANSSILLSKDGSCPYIFNSYEAMYNYSHGSQDAYLASKIFETGEDIKFSINDMNDNIGSKIDDLIDSINNKKEGMSADELQKAIDDALASISGKIDDIGDNTEETNNKLDALLEAISGTNQILMQILGVTTDIRDVVKTTDEEGNQYTMSDVKDCFNTMYNNLKYSILYGKNVSNNPDAANVSTAAYVSYSDVSTYADTSAETLDYKDGLFGKFPFSVPYQLYEWLQVLQTEEMVPQFTYNYGFLIGQKGKQEYDLTFDLSAYQSWADVLKSFLRLSFTLIMSVFIYNKFKGEI